MRKRFNNSKLKFYIGDVRDYKAFKCFPWRGLYISRCGIKTGSVMRVSSDGGCKTNVLGTENVLEAAIQNKVGELCA